MERIFCDDLHSGQVVARASMIDQAALHSRYVALHRAGGIRLIAGPGAGILLVLLNLRAGGMRSYAEPRHFFQ
jgi:hypothetical protein